MAEHGTLSHPPESLVYENLSLVPEAQRVRLLWRLWAHGSLPWLSESPGIPHHVFPIQVFLSCPWVSLPLPRGKQECENSPIKSTFSPSKDILHSFTTSIWKITFWLCGKIMRKIYNLLPQGEYKQLKMSLLFRLASLSAEFHYWERLSVWETKALLFPALWGLLSLEMDFFVPSLLLRGPRFRLWEGEQSF